MARCNYLKKECHSDEEIDAFTNSGIAISVAFGNTIFKYEDYSGNPIKGEFEWESYIISSLDPHVVEFYIKEN